MYRSRSMNGTELFRLGRRLMKLGIAGIPPSGFRELPTSVRMVLVDVYEHPGSTIGQIVDRTGFPQSIVSAAVARLRESGALETTTDPTDRRRTLVAPSTDARARAARAEHEQPPIDDLLAAALVERHGPDGALHVAEATAALEVLARLLTPPPGVAGPGDDPCAADPAARRGACAPPGLLATSAAPPRDLHVPEPS
jgi:DNA-binding MarR family transcriptional regulator